MEGHSQACMLGETTAGTTGRTQHAQRSARSVPVQRTCAQLACVSASASPSCSCCRSSSASTSSCCRSASHACAACRNSLSCACTSQAGLPAGGAAKRCATTQPCGGE